MTSRNTVLLRLAVAVAFLYPAIDGIFDPNAWIGWFPQFIVSFVTAHGISDITLLAAWGIVEAIIGLWILWGKNIFWPSVVATIMLVLIVVFNLALIDIVFRDVAIALVTATLAWWSYRTT